MLGPCLASALPASIMSSITPTVLLNRISYFSGPKFQPDAPTAQAFSNKLRFLQWTLSLKSILNLLERKSPIHFSAVSQLDGVRNNQAEFFSNLGDSIVFFQNIGSIDKVRLVWTLWILEPLIWWYCELDFKRKHWGCMASNGSSLPKRRATRQIKWSRATDWACLIPAVSTLSSWEPNQP